MKIHLVVLQNRKPILGLALLLMIISHAPAMAQSLEKGFSELVKKTSAGVVNISTFAKPRMRQGPNGMPEGFPFPFWFFQDPRQMERSVPKAPSKPAPYSLGTGFIIDSSGLILTNFHVIGDAEQVKVQFKEDDTQLSEAEVIGKDPELDVALLKVKSKEPLTVLPLGDSDSLSVGEFVLAIGNPMGYGHSVSHGILSAKNRKSPEFRLGRYLQTDASINPGNSGGPLLNMKGEVIGINNAIDARAQGIGFAIPINLVKSVLNQLKTVGSVARGYIGISIGELTPEIAEQLKFKKQGALVVEVQKGLPAEQAGIRPYDVIISANGQSVKTASDLTEIVTSVPVGSTVVINLVREGKEKNIPVKVAKRPMFGLSNEKPSQPKRLNEPERLNELERFGFSADILDENVAKAFGIPLEEAQKPQILVTEIQYGKPAAESGLLRGDVILDVAGKDVRTLDAINSELKRQAQKHKNAILRIKRYNSRGEGQVLMLTLKLGT